MLKQAIITWLEKALGNGAQFVSATESSGATSSGVYFVQVRRKKIPPGKQHEPKSYVLRVFTNRSWLESEPDLAEHEAAVLTKAKNAGLPSPALIAHAPDDAACGNPAILMSCLPGQVQLRPPDFADWLTQQAEMLARIHQIAADDFPWQYKSWTSKDSLQPPAWSEHPHLWTQAIDFVLQGQPDYAPVFIHRDYHPVNILWQNSQLSAVVDWTNGCRGPAGVDVAHCRANLWAMYGPEAAEQFRLIYEQVRGDGYVHHPYWDLDSVLGALPDPGYYPPWLAFGLGEINQSTLRQRCDAYLKMVVARL